MIARYWRGWTQPYNADAYENLLRTRVLPDLKNIAGYKGGHVLRQDGDEEVESVALNVYASLEAARRLDSVSAES